MKDYEKEMIIKQNDLESAVYWMDELSHGDGVEVVPGALIDNFFIDVGDARLKSGRVKIRRYNCFIETYLNEWSSCYTWISTDNKGRFLLELNDAREDYAAGQGVAPSECEDLQFIY